MHFIAMLERSEHVLFEPIIVNQFSLSIQASRTHYCSPRETLQSAGMYDKFEVALFEKNEWLNPMEDERFASLHEELKEHWESGPVAVGAYIPSDLVQKLFELVQGLENSESTEQPSEAAAE